MADLNYAGLKLKLNTFVKHEGIFGQNVYYKIFAGRNLNCNNQ